MCKLERYGNCDEETKDQEYCIFHKPNKSEEEAREFYEKFLKKFKPKKEKKIIIDLVDMKEIERLIFEEAVDYRRYVFPEIPEGVDFSFAFSVFKGDAQFENATFKGSASFEGATFEEGASFEDATFEEDALFWRAIFKGGASFWGAIFKGRASFLGTIFKGIAWFEEARFEDDALFERATFEEDALFWRAIFKGIAWFKDATFEKGAWFEDATFKGMADFLGKRVNFECKFYDELNFSNTEFRRGVFIDIPSERFKLPSAEAEACRVQRISYEREGRKDDADRMFVRERRALRRAEVEEAKANVREVKALNPTSFGKKVRIWFVIKATSNYLLAKGRSSLEFLLADLTCEYGTNWKRPVILWMLFVFFIFPLLYFILGGITKVSSILDYLYFSIVTATTLGYGDLQPIGWCKLIASTEAIFGTFMWAVFLVVFARKYMR